MQTYARSQLSDVEAQRLWQGLQAEVRACQLLPPSLQRAAFRLGLLTLLLGAAFALVWTTDSLALRLIGWLALALLLAQFAFVGHDAGHGSLTRSRRLNRGFGQLAMTVVTGLAFDEWIRRHLQHHSHCQDEIRDPDMDVAWVVSLTARAAAAKSPLGSWLTRQQHRHIGFLSFFFGHSQRHLSQWAVLRDLRRHPIDALMLAAHFGLWFGLPIGLLGLSFSAALWTYLVPLTLLGPYLAAIFWVNHIGMPLVHGDHGLSFVEHQSQTSRTVINPPALNWLFGGLNFQVEHHLLPRLPAAQLARVQPIVRRQLSAAGLPYAAVGWFAAARLVAAHLRAVARAA